MDDQDSLARKTPAPDPDMRPASEREVPEWETTVGKIIFYLIVAASIWFFYWLNGINCPC